MTWKPRTWDFKTWFVVLFSIGVGGTLSVIAKSRSFDDAIEAARIGLPLITAAVLAWGLSEISRQEERKSQDRRLQDDRDHERDLRDADVRLRREDASRTYRQAKLEQLGELLDLRVSTARTLADYAYLDLIRPRPERIETRKRVNEASALFRSQEAIYPGLLIHLDNEEGINRVMEVFQKTLSAVGCLETATLIMSPEEFPSDIVGKELSLARDFADEAHSAYIDVKVQDIALTVWKIHHPDQELDIPRSEVNDSPAGSHEVAPDSAPDTALGSSTLALDAPPATVAPAPDMTRGRDDGSPL